MQDTKQNMPQPGEFAVRPTPDDARLSRTLSGIDHTGAAVDVSVVTERPLTLFLNSREIVTMMTIGDHPELLASASSQPGHAAPDDDVTGIDYDEDIADRHRAHGARPTTRISSRRRFRPPAARKARSSATCWMN
jgi:formate dehydrogenase assembly factor FdhD